MIEVLVAMLILSIVMLGLQATISDRIVTSVGKESHRATASQLSKDRLAQIQIDPGYLTLQARYAGVEAPVTGSPLFSRSTAVVSSVAGTGDYKTVTVKVWANGSADTVARTAIISAP